MYGLFKFKKLDMKKPSKIGLFLCRIGLHRWKFSHDTGINEYYECSRCKKRDVQFCSLDGYQPIDTDWLNDI